jgi:hypothetical protein
MAAREYRLSTLLASFSISPKLMEADPSTPERLERFLDPFLEESFQFDGDVRSMFVHEAQTNLPEASHVHAWLFRQTPEALRDEAVAAGRLPTPEGQIELSRGGPLKTPAVRVWRVDGSWEWSNDPVARAAGNTAATRSKDDDDVQLMSRALEAQNAGRIEEAVGFFKETVAEARTAETRFIAAREIVLARSKQFQETHDQSYLRAGTPQFEEFRRYVEIAVETFPHVHPNVQQKMPIDDFRVLLGALAGGQGGLPQSSGVNEGAMRQVARDLVGLRARHGERVTVAADREEAVGYVRAEGFRFERGFAVDDPQLVNAVDALAGRGGAVVVIPDFPSSYEVYVRDGAGVAGGTALAARGAGKRSGLAAWSLGLGLYSVTLGWLCLGFLTAPAALVTGVLSLLRVRSDPERHGGKALAIAGIALGLLYLAVFALTTLRALLRWAF